MVLIGIILHAAGGFAAGSFYMPFKRVRGWAWESYWLAGGLFAWLIAPWLVAIAVVTGIFPVLAAAPVKSILWSFLFGLLWGVGGLTFGLSVRYLGMSLGYAVSLGFCAAFGTIMPPVYTGTFAKLFSTVSGLVTLSGVAICLGGIGICGRAGVLKERELSADARIRAIEEFDLAKGLAVAVFAGVMSGCMAFGIAAGKPIAKCAVEAGTPSLWQNSAVMVVVLGGGFITNALWCVSLGLKKGTISDFANLKLSPLAANYGFSAIAGITWYLQFMFYGMGTTKMGKYDFSSWTIHMAFIIVFSNMWALLQREWAGCSRRTLRTIITGIGVVLISTIVIGAGSCLAAIGK